MTNKIFSVFVLLFTLIFYQNITSQNNTNRISDQAENLYAQGEYEKIIPLANQRIKELLGGQNVDSLEISKLYLHLTATYYKLRENQKSIDISKIGLDYCLNTNEGNNVKAGILYWRSFPEYFLNKPYKSYESKKEAVELLKNNEHPDLEFLTGAYAELSLDMAFMGYLDKATTYIEKAIATNKIKNSTARSNNTYSIDEDLELWLQYRLAQVNNKKLNLEFDKNLQLEIKETINRYNEFKKQHPKSWPSNKRIMQGIIYSFYGNSFLTNSKNFRNPDSALHYYQIASRQFKKSENPYQYNAIIYNISRAYKNKGDYNEALKIIEKLIIDDKNPNSSSYSTYVTNLMLNLNRFEEWEKLAYETITKIHDSPSILKPDFSNFVPSTSINQISDILSLAESIDIKNPEMSFLIETKKRLYGIAVEQFKASYRFSSFNTRLKNYYQRVFGGHLEMIVNEGKVDSSNISKLLNDTENIENRIAWKKFNKSRHIVNLPLVDSIEQVEYQLRKNLVNAKQNMASRQTDSLSELLEEHNQRIDLKYPKYSEFVKESFDIRKFQNIMSQEEVILKYLYFEDKLIVFEIAHDTISTYLKPWAENEKKILETHLKQIVNKKDLSQQNEYITNILLPKSISNYKKITIITDNAINQLPFETLTYKNNYLVETKSISYSSHLRFIFTEKESKTNPDQDPLVSVFAPDYSGTEIASATRSGSYNLIGAQKEAAAIKNIFEATAFIGKEATKKKFIAHKTEGSILHLAMHATMDEVNPMLSHFNFPENEKLHIEELYALKIPADLAVLSACNTASGEEDSSMSINSLQRAFNYAGTKATIASLWEVPDESTSQIMISFYENLKKGESKSSALQKAKTDYLKNTEVAQLKHPYYWAGFVVYGSDTPIVSQNSPIKWYILLSIMVISLIGMYLYRKRKTT